MTTTPQPYPGYNKDAGTVHGMFSCSYANYLVLPRSVLQDAPVEWQKKFTDVMEELWDSADWPNQKYTVTARDKRGRFAPDPLSNYRYPDRSLIKWK